MAIKIDTGKVETAASKIETLNKKINEDFSDVKDAINKLDKNWDGNASHAVIRKFHDLENNFCENRYTVLKNLVTFMRNQVSLNYSDTETQIKSIADAFK